MAGSFETLGHEGFEVLGRPETVAVPVVLHSGGHDDQPFVEMMRISDSSGSTRCARPHICEVHRDDGSLMTDPVRPRYCFGCPRSSAVRFSADRALSAGPP